jgi:hypothetical protein
VEEREILLEKLEKAVRDFARAVVDLPEPLFLKRIDGWTPRDVVAHLIGWNRLTVTGCEEVLRGEPPAYLDDVDEGFSHVNAAFVREHDATDRDRLLGQLRASAAETAAYARSLPRASWEASVRFRRWTISVGDCVDGLRQDYVTHRERIEAWAADRSKHGEKP